MSSNKVLGGCQCGAVRFEATGVDTEKTIACNCSRCGRIGSILSFVPAAQFHETIQGEALTEYRFNKHVIQHLFCKTCGVQVFGRGKSADGVETVAVNVRCLDGINVHDLKPQLYDGRDA